MNHRTNEQHIEQAFIAKLQELKYTYRPDIRDWDSLQANFRQKFEALNRVKLSEQEFSRLLEQIIRPDVFQAAKLLREPNSLERDDGTPLVFTLVNLKDWCKNEFEVINQLRINTSNSYHRYDVLLLLNGIPVVQVELKTLAISPRKAMQQIVDYKNDVGNGYGNTLLCFVQLFIVSNRSDTWYFANGKLRRIGVETYKRSCFVFFGEVMKDWIVQGESLRELSFLSFNLGIGDIGSTGFFFIDRV